MHPTQQYPSLYLINPTIPPHLNQPLHNLSATQWRYELLLIKRTILIKSLNNRSKFFNIITWWADIALCLWTNCRSFSFELSVIFEGADSHLRVVSRKIAEGSRVESESLKFENDKACFKKIASLRDSTVSLLWCNFSSKDHKKHTIHKRRLTTNQLGLFLRHHFVLYKHISVSWKVVIR